MILKKSTLNWQNKILYNKGYSYEDDCRNKRIFTY